MDFFLVLLLTLIVAVIVAVIKVPEEIRKEEEKEDRIRDKVSNIKLKIKEIENFNISNFTMNKSNTYAIAVDDTSHRFCIARSSSQQVYDFKDLLEVELIENGESLIKTSRGSQILGVAVGGVLLGGVGAVIGGLSGKKNTSHIINNIELKLTLKDSKISIFSFVFFKRVNKEDSPQIYVHRSHKWHSIMKAIITQTERNIQEEENKIQDDNSLSIPDEILKFKKLKDDGIITEEEFNNQKSKLLK